MLSYELLDKTAQIHGDSFYLIDSEIIRNNYTELLNAFQKKYFNTRIAYSYKTNYTPHICKLIDDLGGDAEIVSEMELWLAKRIGIEPSKIYYNGPYKKYEYIEEALLSGVHVNLDAEYEITMIRSIADRFPGHLFEVGLRCNVDIGQEVPSRFGFNIVDGSLQKAMQSILAMPNVKVTGLHCHIPFRTLESYKQRVEKMNAILDMFPEQHFSYISMGGGYMGKIDEQMRAQFDFMPPSFDNYADVVAGFMKNRYQDHSDKPILIIEPGSAIVANSMKYVTRVINIKNARDNKIAGLTGSTFQMNPSVKDMNRPLEVYQSVDNAKSCAHFDNLYMAGYTCIESDYLYKGYCGKLGVGDFVVFCNVGSYSVVMKPPFILPDIPIIEIRNDCLVNIWKNAQTPEDVFRLYDSISV